MTYLVKRQNKFGNVNQTYKGYTYMSKKEAAYAQELDLRVKAKDIISWERQFKVSIDINDYHICNYYVDFLIHHKNGTKELVEIKGFETAIWKLKAKLLEAVFLVNNPEYIYTVIK